MEKSAHAQFVRIGCRKARVVIDTIRGRRVDEAMDALRFIPKSAIDPVLKVVKSAIANAKQADATLEDKNLFIKKCWVDQGPAIKRWRPRAHGRATRIRKGTSHIHVVVSDEGR